MKKAAVPILLFLLLLPGVAAAQPIYYPSESAFRAFLSSNSSFTVIPGNDTWARAWAHYVDARLSTLKPHGNDTLVLVGNVADNALMRRLWNETGLPENASFLPSMIVLNGTVLITGSRDNIYLTERAFQHVWRPSRGSKIAFLVAVFTLMLVFILALRRDGSHAGKFYGLAASLYVVWYLTAPKPPISENFLREMLSALEFTVGGAPGSALGALLGIVFRFVPPVEENLVYIHWLLVLLIASLTFYLAPRRNRELGFLVFGLLFVAPMFRNGLEEINGSTLGLAGFMLTLAMASNVTFSPERWKALGQTAVLSAFTLLAIAVNPYLVFIPVFFVLAFPKRHLRNYAYLGTVGLGVFLLYRTVGLSIWVPSSMNPASPQLAKKFLLDGGLAMGVSVYSLINRKSRIGMKGATAFLLLLTALYIPMALFVPSLFQYSFVLVSALAVRLLHGVTGGT